MYLERRSGRYYCVLKIPTHLRAQLGQREIRLSLYTYHRLQAKEMAHACWLALREILKNSENFKFSTMDELKSHIREAAMAHSPDGYTSLIELTGSADNAKLAAAIKVLMAYGADFFVIAPKAMQGKIAKKVNGDWDVIARIHGQTFPHMRVPIFLIQDAITCDLEVIHPEHLFYTSAGEERMVWIDNQVTITYAHLFIRSDVDPAATTIIRKLSETPAPMAASTQVVAPVHDSDFISKEIERYCKEKTTQTIAGDKRSTAWNPDTHDEQKSKLRLFLEIVGDKPALMLNRKDYDKFVDELRRCPKARNTNPETKGKSWQELMAMNLTNVISPSTVIQYHMTVTAFIMYLDERYKGKGMDTSIQSALKASGIHKQVANQEDSRLPFTDEHISLMFDSDKSIEYLTQAAIGPEKAWKLFVPALGVTSGARLNELCSFLLCDIGEENGIVYMDMNLDADERKSLKNKNSKRRIPLHPVMKEIHFMEYVEYMRSLPEGKTKKGRLFPTLTPIRGHGYRKYMTDWFNQDFLVHLGIKTSKLNFHSYRWRVINILQRKATPDTTWRIDRYLGHEHGKKEPASIRFYMTKSLADTVPVLDDITFSVNWARYAKLCRRTYK